MSEFRVSHVDSAGRELGFSDGATSLAAARQEAEIGLRASVYSNGVRVLIYRGSQVVETVERP